MAAVSKEMFESACAGLQCCELLHPWARDCWSANLWCFLNSVKGSYQFYTYVYIAQMLMKGKLLSKDEFKVFGEQFVRSGILGLLISSSACTFNCILRNLVMGKFSYYTFLLVPNTLNGLAIYLEPPGRRSLVINLFFNLVLEFWIRLLEKAGHIAVTPAKQTFFFMIGSACLFYLMRLEGDKKSRTTLLWFFTPDRIKRKINNNNVIEVKDNAQNACPHNSPCWSHILKGTGKLFGVGFAITAARVVLPKITSPIRALGSLRANHFKLALFFGGYIGIYRTVICLLCRHYGEDSALFALPAGFLAGLSFRWNPSLGFSIAAVTAAMKLFSTILYEKKLITERVPLPELLFCVCQGILYHARYMHPDACPKYIFNLMSTVSNGCVEQIYGKMIEALKLAQ